MPELLLSFFLSSPPPPPPDPSLTLSESHIYYMLCRARRLLMPASFLAGMLPLVCSCVSVVYRGVGM